MKQLKGLLTVVLWVSLSSFSIKDSLPKIYNKIKLVESKGNPEAIGDGGKAFGEVQIHKIAVDDVNRLYGTSYTHEDSFDKICSEEIFSLYLTAGIDIFCKKFGRDPTEEEVVRMWNGGIYDGFKEETTIRYYMKYREL